MRFSTKPRISSRQRLGVVVDPGSSTVWLISAMPASASRAMPPAPGVSSRGWLAVHGEIGGLPLAFSASTSAASTRSGSTIGTRVWKRTTFTCGMAREPRHQLAEPARRQHQRIAAGQDHFPDFRLRGDIGEAVSSAAAHSVRAPRPHHLAAEAEAAIDRADMHRLEQHAVGIAMHDALDRGVRDIADRVGSLLRRDARARGVGDELAGDRIVGSSRSISAAMAGVMATAMVSAAAAKRGSGMTSPSRSRASSVRRVSIAAVT